MKKTIAVIVLTSLGISSSLLSFAADMTVYKTPDCGCCQKWADAIEDNGYNMQVHAAKNLNQIKIDMNLPTELAACHTATLGNYVVEGHVPLQVIDWLNKTKPEGIIGVSVPSMPQDSLGMESLLNQEEYIVYGFTQNGDINELFKFIGDKMIEDYTI